MKNTYYVFFLLLIFLACEDEINNPEIYNISEQKFSEIKVEQISLDQVKISWTKPTWEYETIRIERETISETAERKYYDLSKDKSELITTITPINGEKYKYTVRAQDAEKFVSKSSEAEIEIQFEEIKNFESKKLGLNKYEIQWTHSAKADIEFSIDYQDKYGLWKDLSQIEITKEAKPELEYDIYKASFEKNIEASKTLELKIHARFKNGYSPSTSHILDGPLSNLKNVAVKGVNESSVELTWDTYTGRANKIIIEKRIDDGNWVLLTEKDDITITNFVDTSSPSGSKYEYRLQTTSEGNYSDKSIVTIFRERPRINVKYPTGNLKYIPKMLRIEYNTDVVKFEDSKQIKIHNKLDDKLVASYSLGRGVLLMSSYLVINNLSGLDYNTEYYVVIDKGIVADTEKNPTNILEKSDRFEFKTPEKQTIEFVNVAAGDFTIRAYLDPKNQTRYITLTNDFKMGKYEITTLQFAEFLNEKGVEEDGIYNGNILIGNINYTANLEYKNGVFVPSLGNENKPVNHVTWHGANEFCKHHGASLPTEAQWEFAANGGNASTGIDYSNSTVLSQYAWYNGNSGSKLQPIGTKKANELGIHDMLGNVEEWCSDWYDANYFTDFPHLGTMVNPTGPVAGAKKVLKGGSYYLGSTVVNIGYRSYDSPQYSEGIWNGFRIVKN